MKKEKVSKNEYIKELALVRGWMLDIFYNSCGENIEEVFGKKIASELKVFERKESILIRKSMG
jgi:hypothetical protein